MNILIRQEIPNDYPFVYELVANAFQQEDESILVDKLRRRPSFIHELSLIAQVDDTVVGHILFTPIVIRRADGSVVESLSLAPISVLPGYQNKGIGNQLVEQGLAVATKLGYKSVIVLGHPGYYPRLGFSPAKKWGITAPLPVPDEVLMAIELQPESLQNASGVLEYPDEFWE